MTARKPKPRKAAPRKRAKGPTLTQRVAFLETRQKMIWDWCNEHTGKSNRNFLKIKKAIDALETRKQFRDASHDEPVSNAAEERHLRWWHRLASYGMGWWP